MSDLTSDQLQLLVDARRAIPPRQPRGSPANRKIPAAEKRFLAVAHSLELEQRDAWDIAHRAMLEHPRG